MPGTRLLPLSAVLLLLPLAACGSGSSAVWEDHDRTYTSLGTRDGFATSNGFAWSDGTVESPGAGDLDIAFPGEGAAALFCFETSGISGDAEIISATLRVYQEGLNGTPYPSLGDLVVDHVDIGAGVDPGDFGGGTRRSNIGTLSTTAATGWKEVDVREAIQTNVSNRHAYSEFRIRFSVQSNGNGSNDNVEVNDGEDSRGTGHLPTLIVRYRAPRL